MEEIIKVLGQRLKRARKLRRLTQEQLAEKAQISYKFIGEIERGQRNPTIMTIAKIAKALHIPVAQLFREDEDLAYPFDKNEKLILKNATKILNKLFNDEEYLEKG